VAAQAAVGGIDQVIGFGAIGYEDGLIGGGGIAKAGIVGPGKTELLVFCKGYGGIGGFFEFATGNLHLGIIEIELGVTATNSLREETAEGGVLGRLAITGLITDIDQRTHGVDKIHADGEFFLPLLLRISERLAGTGCGAGSHVGDAIPGGTYYRAYFPGKFIEDSFVTGHKGRFRV